MKTSNIKELTMIALFPALMGATAGISIPLFGLPPITLQTFFVYLAGLMLGPRNAILSMTIYVLIGALGVPVFSGYTGGIAIILGKSGGFLVGFIVSAFLISIMKNVNFINNKFMNQTLTLVISTTVLYVCGASYIAYLYNLDIRLVLANFPIYFVGDIIKLYASVLIYERVSKVFIYEYA